MKRLLLSFLLLLVLYAQAVIAETVYKGVDKQGNVIYSDKPLPNGEQITVTPPPPIEMPTVKETTTQTQSTVVDPNLNYKLAIVSPLNHETFPHSTKDVEVKLSLTPELLPGDRINLIVNGKPYGEYTEGLSFILKEFPRGAYTISAVITSEKDPEKVKAQSDSITYYQQRAIAKQAPPPGP